MTSEAVAPVRSDLTVAEILSADDPSLALRTVFQPLVNLTTGSVVGFEALTRGPAGSNLERPDALFAAAEAEGRLTELDHVCQAVAMETAVDTPTLHGHLVFINAEPVALAFDPPDRLMRAWDAALAVIRPVMEISERRVLDNPAYLLEARRFFQRKGILVAVDDVGVNPASLALLPLIEPDVVKLDMCFAQDDLNPARAAVLNAVIDYQERSGALLVIEGVETEDQMTRAVGFGADLGQGFYWSYPTEPGELGPASHLLMDRVSNRTWESAATPYELVSSDRRARVASKEVLLNISLDLEDQASRMGDGPLVLASFQRAEYFGTGAQHRYLELSDTASFVAALAVGLGPRMLPGVHTNDLSTEDPLALEWNVVVLSPHFAGALLAVDLGDEGPDLKRRFRYSATFDRGIVSEAARILVARVERDD